MMDKYTRMNACNTHAGLARAANESNRQNCTLIYSGMLPFNLSERIGPTWEQEEQNRRGTSNNPVPAPPEPHPESTQVSPTGG